MRILTRYILFELLKVFLVSLFVMTTFMEVILVGQEAIRQGLGPRQIFMVLPYATPMALQFAVPGTILFAACSVYGRLSSSNEIVAMKSLGISPWAFVWPGLALAFVLSLTAVWLNDLAVSWGTAGVRRVIVESVEEIVYNTLRSKGVYSAPGGNSFSINVRKVEDRKLLRTMLTISGGEGRGMTTIEAEEAELNTDLENHKLIIVLRNARVESDIPGVGPTTYKSAVPLQHEVSLDEASRKGVSLTAASQMPLRDLEQELARTSNALVATQQRLATQAAYQLLMGDFTALNRTAWDGDMAQLRDAKMRYHRTSVEPYRRWANGFSCLAFVMVGMPLAVRMRNADFTTSFFLCFLPVLLFFYPLIIVGTDQVKAGNVPPLYIWSGNVVFAVVAFFLMRKVWRY